MIDNWGDALVDIAYFVSAMLFVFSIWRLSSPKTARQGNYLSMVAMGIAIVATFFIDSVERNYFLMVLGLLIGGAISYWPSMRVPMTAMPQMVAIFNGMGGATVALIAIVEFLEVSQERVHAAGARLGASVFGIAATRPDEVAQDIPRMAEVTDYIAPMVYPSHWGPGEYGVADPNSQPYDIVHLSLQDFVRQTAGSDAHVVAWLQDFSLGVDYGVAEVAAQIEASIDAGVENILLWDAATTYTTDALRD